MTYRVVVRTMVVSTTSVGKSFVVELGYSLSIVASAMVVVVDSGCFDDESPLLGPGPTGGTCSPSYGSKAATAAQKLFLLSLSRAAVSPFRVIMLTLALVLTPRKFTSELTMSIMLSWQLLSSTHCCV